MLFNSVVLDCFWVEFSVVCCGALSVTTSAWLSETSWPSAWIDLIKGSFAAVFWNEISTVAPASHWSRNSRDLTKAMGQVALARSSKAFVWSVCDVVIGSLEFDQTIEVCTAGYVDL